jgi:hypothetical protein
MKLQKALKEKKRLVGEIAKLKNQIQQKNSYVEGVAVNYNLVDLYETLEQKITELIELKMLIYFANATIQSKILRLAEVKGLINFWNSVPTIEGLIMGLNNC